MGQACSGSNIGLGTGFGHCQPKQVHSGDRDVQTRHFERSLGLVMPRVELVSAHWPNLVSHNPQLKERMTRLILRTSFPVCIPHLLVVAVQASLVQSRSEPVSTRA